VGHDGNLYGTSWGGAYGYGTIFQLAPSGIRWTKTILYNFQNTQSDGEAPGNLIQDGAGNLYGISTWVNDGEVYNIVFMLSPSNGKWVFTELSLQSQYPLLSGAQGGINNLAIDAAGNLYGTAASVWYINCGAILNAYIFKLVPRGSGWQLTYPADFGDEWFNSNGMLSLDAQGDLYGTSANCGANGYGTVWELSP
jgi:uncharacterized repeat protein (TIGR03803 family)